MGDRPSLLRTTGSISAAVLISRVLGLARDQVLSFYFGAGAVTDAFFAAFRIPNLLRDLFAEGALSSAFIPTFTAERRRRGDAAAWTLANRVFTALFVILGVVSVLILVLAPAIVGLFTPGFDPERAALAVTMTRILSPFLLCVALAAVAMGILNAHGRFFLPALASAFFNVGSIVGMVALVPVLGALGVHTGLALAIGATLGGALQFLVQVPEMRRAGLRFRPELDLTDPALRRIGVLMLPATFGLAATQINLLVDTILASGMGNAISWLQYAFRLMQLPIGLFGVAIATANLARVSHDAARGDLAAMRASLAGSLRAAALLTLPATAGLIALREPIVRVLFEHGRFDALDTLQTSRAVLCYALGLYAYAVAKIQVPTFYALGETRRPVIASAGAVSFKIAANFGLLALLPRFGIEAFLALALSTSVAAWTNLALLSLGLRARIGSLRGLGVFPATARMILLSAGVGLISGGAHELLERWMAPGGFSGEVLRLAAATLAGAAAAALGAHYAGMPEAAALAARLRLGMHRRR